MDRRIPDRTLAVWFDHRAPIRIYRTGTGARKPALDFRTVRKSYHYFPVRRHITNYFFRRYWPQDCPLARFLPPGQ